MIEIVIALAGVALVITLFALAFHGWIFGVVHWAPAALSFGVGHAVPTVPSVPPVPGVPTVPFAPLPPTGLPKTTVARRLGKVDDE